MGDSATALFVLVIAAASCLHQSAAAAADDGRSKLLGTWYGACGLPIGGDSWNADHYDCLANGYVIQMPYVAQYHSDGTWNFTLTSSRLKIGKKWWYIAGFSSDRYKNEFKRAQGTGYCNKVVDYMDDDGSLVYRYHTVTVSIGKKYDNSSFELYEEQGLLRLGDSTGPRLSCPTQGHGRVCEAGKGNRFLYSCVATRG